MAIEIERKFLVSNQDWRVGAVGTLFRQGYLSTEPERTLRVRLEGAQGRLTVKGKASGISRVEFDYAIPPAEATAMLDSLCLRPLIEKTRYRVEYAGHCWEIDEFHGENRGLIIAEIELAAVNSVFALPGWIGPEVSDDPRYFNANLVKLPFSCW